MLTKARSSAGGGLTCIMLLAALALPGYAQQSAPKPTTAASSQPAIASSPKPTETALSADEIHALRKLKMQEELQAELLAWAQGRFWLIAGLAVVVGFFGVRSLVREMLAADLKDAMKATAEAAAAAAQGREVVREVRSEANKYSDEVRTLTATAGDVQRQFTELRSRVDAEGVRLGAALELKVLALQQQIAELTTSVTELAHTNAAQPQGASSTAERIEDIRRAAESKDESFAANSNVKIVVVHHRDGSRTKPLASDLVSRLSKLGFKASEGLWAESKKDESSIVDVQVNDKSQPFSEVIAEAVRVVLSEHSQPPAMKVSSQSWSEDYDVRIFF